LEPQPVLVASVHTPKGDWDALLQKHFGSEWERAKKVMLCESGGRETAHGDRHLTYWKDGREWGSSAGLFQIRDLPGRPAQEWLMVGENNIAYAAGMYKAQSWRPWTCKKVLGL
jgi:hypothetical protein